MGLFRGVGFLVVLVACDQGELAPAKGSAHPPPAPLPAPTRAPPTQETWVRSCNDTGRDITRFDWNGKVKEPTVLPNGWCTTFLIAYNVSDSAPITFEVDGVRHQTPAIVYGGKPPLEPGHWSWHIDHLDAMHVAAAHVERDPLTKDPQSYARVCNDTDHDIELIASPAVRMQDLSKRSCTDYKPKSFNVFVYPFVIGSDTSDPNGMDRLTSPDGPAEAHALPPGRWSYHITKLDVASNTVHYDPRPDVSR